jgi:DnaA-homolog protein
MTPAPPGQRSAPADSGQLALRFPLSSRCRFGDFVVGDNAELVRRLEELPRPRSGIAGCFLSGSAGSGRTHLLQAACHLHGSRGGAIYLPLADIGVVPELLDGLEGLALVALDDVQHWIGDERREAALLALYQGLLAGGGCLLVSADAPASQLPFRYADLGSRLRGLPAYQVREPDDAGKAQVLARLARERGLELGSPVIEFWLARSSRNLADLLDQLDRLDAAAMAAQRRVTVPLVKEVLGL